MSAADVKTLAKCMGVCLISVGVQLLPKNLRERAASVFAVVLVFLLLWTAALAATPSHQGHHWAGGSAAHDHCVVCLFAYGKIIAPDVTPISIRPSVRSSAEVLMPRSAPPADVQWRLPLGRAPPVVFS